jgi:hypothetical protein
MLIKVEMLVGSRYRKKGGKRKFIDLFLLMLCQLVLKAVGRSSSWLVSGNCESIFRTVLAFSKAA